MLWLLLNIVPKGKLIVWEILEAKIKYNVNTLRIHCCWLGSPHPFNSFRNRSTHRVIHKTQYYLALEG